MGDRPKDKIETLLLSEEESERAIKVSEEYMAFCRADGREPPPDTFRAVLAAGEEWVKLAKQIGTAVVLADVDESKPN